MSAEIRRGKANSYSSVVRRVLVLEREVDVHSVRERVHAGVGARADERAHRRTSCHPLHRLQRVLRASEHITQHCTKSSMREP